MSKRLYVRLAVTNIKNNRKFYLPYLLMGIFTVAMYYIMCAINGNEGLDTMPSAGNVKLIMTLGTIVIGIFGTIFIFYTNSFIIKRRKKEIGIYNILGMEKRHIFRVLFLETVFLGITAVVCGLVTGIVFNKLMCMLLYQLLGYDAGIGFYVSVSGVTNTALLFLAIYFLTLLYNTLQIKLANPIALLYGGNVGEREPKTKTFMTIVGIGCMFGGYYISITTENPLTAVMLFFVAVLLVIIGTYCLFTAGSITLLKLLRKNKSYYYKTKHFSAVSFLLYRMKQNAAGLANICVLSTAVLVMISATVSLYFGTKDALKTMYPTDIAVTVDYTNVEADVTELQAMIEQTISDNGRRIKTMNAYTDLTVAAAWQNGKITFDKEMSRSQNLADMAYLWVITAKTCEEQFDCDVPELAENEIILCNSEDFEYDRIEVGDEEFIIKGKRNLISDSDEYIESMVGREIYMIVKDNAVLDKIYEMQMTAYQENASNYSYNLELNLDGTGEEKMACHDEISETLSDWIYKQPVERGIADGYTRCRQDNEAEYRTLIGGFLFLGIFLGVMFLMITVLIIFYKQISEGYDDRERFVIMRKVGMSDGEVKTTIRSQIRTVFFLPLVTATFHVAAAFPLIRRLLLLFGLANIKLFALCMIVTVLIFALIYLLVFRITSGTYYRIVGE